jgi:hypothetical protein
VARLELVAHAAVTEVQIAHDEDVSRCALHRRSRASKPRAATVRTHVSASSRTIETRAGPHRGPDGRGHESRHR